MDSDSLRATTPQPGDPRSRGPRPAATWRDAAWLSLSTALVAVTVVQLVTMTIVLLRVELTTSTAALFLGFVITVVWLLTIYWLVMGAWRRSVWGCPFDHDARATDARRCPRHGAARRPGDGSDRQDGV